MKIKVEGFKWGGRSVGRVTRVKGDTDDFEADIVALKRNLRVGPGGSYEIEITQGETTMMRVDRDAIGRRAEQIGTFEEGGAAA